MNTNTSSDNGSLLRQELEKVMKKYPEDLDGIAILLSELLNDPKGIQYYRILLQHNNGSHLLEIAHEVKRRDIEGKLRCKRAIYFIGILRNMRIQTKFKQ